MDIIAVFLAAAVTWGIGAIWYGVISGPWLAVSNMTAEQAAATPKTVYLLSYLCFVVMMGFLQYLYVLADVRGMVEGMLLGAGLGAFVALPWMAINNMYQQRPVLLSVIDGAYAVVGMAAGGAVLGLF